MNLQDIIDKRNLYGIGVNLKNVLSKEEIEFLKSEIVKLNESGMSFIKISNNLNIGRPVIRKWMKDIKYDIINNHNKLRVREDLFKTVTTEEDAYWVGFIYADGYISDGGMLQMDLKHTDYKHLLKFADYCGYDKNKVVEKQTTNFINSFRCRMAFSTQHLVTNFHNIGIVPRKSLTLTFPKWLDESLYSHFIRGYFDGDGSIGIKKLKTLRDYALVSLIGTREFLEKVLEVCNLNYNLHKDKRHKNNTFSINFRKEDGLNFLDYLYKDSTIYLDRKYKLYLQ